MENKVKKRKVETSDDKTREEIIYENKVEEKNSKIEKLQRLIKKKEKRETKREKFVEKVNPRPVEIIKGIRRIKKDKLALDKVTDVIDNIRERSKNEKKTTPGDLALAEVAQLEGIFKIKEFQQDPVSIIQTHLRNTISKKQTRDLAKSRPVSGEKRKRD